LATIDVESAIGQLHSMTAMAADAGIDSGEDFLIDGDCPLGAEIGGQPVAEPEGIIACERSDDQVWFASLLPSNVDAVDSLSATSAELVSSIHGEFAGGSVASLCFSPEGPETTRVDKPLTTCLVTWQSGGLTFGVVARSSIGADPLVELVQSRAADAVAALSEWDVARGLAL